MGSYKRNYFERSLRMRDLVQMLEYLKTAAPILSYTDVTQSWTLEFDMTYGEVFEAPTLQDLADQVCEWLTSDLPEL